MTRYLQVEASHLQRGDHLLGATVVEVSERDGLVVVVTAPWDDPGVHEVDVAPLGEVWEVQVGQDDPRWLLAEVKPASR